MDHLSSGDRLGVNIYYRVQEEPRGTSQAVQLGRGFIGSDDFVVIDGDNYFKPYQTMKDILEFHSSIGADVTLVLHPVEDPRRFGIVKIDNRGNVLGMIEKPTLKEAEPYRFNGQYFSIAGLLVLRNSVFDYIEKTKRGKNNEYWLTDSVELMRSKGSKVSGYIFKGKRYDIGTLESLLKADKLEQMDDERFKK
jgi:UTP--glucose-1-phosphate uridylyltransferase